MKRFRQLVAVILSLAMILSCMAVFADETTEEKAEIRINGELSADTTEKTILYVAKDGDDSNPGTKDAPFATLTKARDAIRSLKASGQIAEGGVVVYVRGGEYIITEGIKFTKEDSGTKDAPVLYRNYPGETVDFVGSASIPWENFEKVTDQATLERIVDKNARKNIYAADLFKLGFTDLPQQSWPGPYSYWSTIKEYLASHGIVAPKGVAPELIINGQAMTIARYPNDSQMEITEVVEDGGVELMRRGKPEDAELIVIGVNDDRVKNWTNAKEALMTGTFQYSWGTLTTQLGSVDPKTNRLTAKYLIVHTPIMNQLFHVYNLIEEIDMPGEYYIDREEGMLYLYPPKFDIQDVKYTMLSDEMFYFGGVSNLTVKGINMKYMRSKAFVIDGNCENTTVQNSEITYTGASSSMAGKNNTILDCWFHDVEGGVAVEGGDPENLIHANNKVENSKFERSDRLTKSYNDAVSLGGVGNIARYNYMGEAEHLVARVSGQEHIYEFNEFAKACTNTDDMSALYSGRALTHKGNIVRYNYFHDIGGTDRGSNGVHGIFFDDFWASADVVGNVFANITGAGCMAAGSHNVFHNNIFVNCGESLRITRSYSYGNNASDEPYLNDINNRPYIYSELWLSKYPEMANVYKDGRLDMNNNIVATNNAMVNTPEPGVSADAEKTITLKNNVTFKKDPGFYDMENNNYLLNEDSDVFKKIPDFKQIPFTRMGMYSDRAVLRVDDAYVFCANSPFVMKDGKIVESDKTETIIENDVMYIPLRSGAESIDASVEFDEETEKVSVSNGMKVLEFISNGNVYDVTVDGTEYKLEKPIINRNHINYISVNDLVNIFNKYLTQYNGISVISDEVLFTIAADGELLRYLEDQLSVY